MTDKQLTVEQVIEKLQKVKDKSTPVYLGDPCGTNRLAPIVSITEESGDVYGRVIMSGGLLQ
jgi:hypothetical protein